MPGIAENASPTAAPAVTAGASDPNVIDVAATEVEGQEGQQADQEQQAEKEQQAKPEKSPEQREIERLRRAIDRKTRLLADERVRNVAPQRQERDTSSSAEDGQTYQLTQAQIDELVNQRATQLAPTLREQAAQVEHRTGVAQALLKTWGKEKFDEITSDLDDVFDGLADQRGKFKPAMEAIFEADSPAAVIEYLRDPENNEEAESISRMSAAQAGKAIAKLEARLAAEVAKNKPKASNAPAPLETVRARGGISGAPDPANTKAWMKWANEQERKGS